MKNIVGIILVVLVLGTILFLKAKPQDSLNNGAKKPIQNEKPTKKSIGFEFVKNNSGNSVLIEAEEFIKIEPPFSKVENSDAVMAKAGGNAGVYLGPEKVNYKEETKKFAKGHPDAKNPGFVSYQFTVPADDDYSLWLRTYWVDDCGDSVSISIDNSPLMKLGGSTYGRWTWNQLHTGNNKASRLKLQKGKTYILNICNREDDLYIDQILLLGTDRSWPDPVGIIKK